MITTTMIPISNIKADAYQPRKTFTDDTLRLLSDTILDNGIAMPIIVRPDEDGSTFIIIEGERRYRASIAAGLKELPCHIKENLTDLGILELQLMVDCTKEKIPADERDKAIYKFFNILDEEDPTELGLKVINRGDWRISYISKRIGISPYVVKMAIDKAQFHNGNKAFIRKVINTAAEDPKKKAEVQRKLNIALEETARDKDLKDNPKKRKEVIETFVTQDVTAEDAIKGSQGLRTALKKGEFPDKHNTMKVPGVDVKSLETEVLNLITKYIANVDKSTAALYKSVMKLGKRKIPKKGLNDINCAFADAVLKLGGKSS